MMQKFAASRVAASLLLVAACTGVRDGGRCGVSVEAAQYAVADEGVVS